MKYMRIKLYFIIFTLLIFSVDNLHANEQQKNVVFILDGSNSMWGQIDDVNKIVIVREVIKDKISILQNGINPSLFAYGHKKTESCSDVEQVLAHAEQGSSLEKHYESFIEKIYAIRPKGKTPIANTIQKVLEVYPPTKNTYDIVLIVDGKDNCNKDLKNIANTLKDDKTDIRVHIIAFDVATKDVEDLRYLSQETNGLFFNSNTKNEFEQALDKIFNVLSDNTLIQQPIVHNEDTNLLVQDAKSDNNVSDSSRQLHLKARLEDGGAVLNKGVMWEIAIDDPNNSAKRRTIKKINQSVIYLGGLGVGEYYIIAHYGHAYGYKKINITKENNQKTQAIDIALNAGGIRVLAYIANSKDLIDDELIIELSEQNEKSEDNIKTYKIRTALNNEIYRLNQGQYKLTGLYGNVNSRIEGLVDIQKGKLSEIKLNFRAGKVIFRLVTKSGKRILNNILWKFYDNLGNEVLETEEVTPSHIFNAGQYNIEVMYENKKYKSLFNVTSAENKIVEVTIE